MSIAVVNGGQEEEGKGEEGGLLLIIGTTSGHLIAYRYAGT